MSALARTVLGALAVALVAFAGAALLAGDDLTGTALAVAATPLLAVRDRLAARAGS